ncbi:MAG: hypothetical protein ABF641_12630 [Acetobacter sp.]
MDKELLPDYRSTAIATSGYSVVPRAKSIDCWLELEAKFSARETKW